MNTVYESDGTAHTSLNRQLFLLAIPAFGALVAEPLFVLIDSAVIGHLGTAELAGLSLASTLLVTIVGLFVFLAYATTASVARSIGAGHRTQAIANGIDGMWLALLLGVITAAIGLLIAPTVIDLMGASPEIAPHAISYLRWSLPGIPGMLIVLAATGVLRGLQDTKTPLVVAVIGAAVNALANIALVYGLKLGIAGSAIGTAAVQTLMAIALVTVVIRGARDAEVRIRPHGSGILRSAKSGIPLFIRTLSLRVAILVTVAVATSLGTVALGAHQIINSLWNFAAFALDALAIAAQAMIGKALGASDVPYARAVLRRVCTLGPIVGAAGGLAMIIFGQLGTGIFTTDPDVQSAVAKTLIVVGAAMPIAGFVFVLDGVLIGAGDGKYLAIVGIVTLFIYLVALGLAHWLAPDGIGGLIALWIAFAGGYIGARAIANGVRARGTTWMILGA